MTESATRRRTKSGVEAEIMGDVVGYWVQVQRKDGQSRTLGPFPRTVQGEQTALDLQAFFQGA